MRRTPTLRFIERFARTAMASRCARVCLRLADGGRRLRFITGPGRALLVVFAALASFLVAAAPADAAVPVCASISITNPAASPYEQLQNLTFDSTSSDADGDVLTYDWDFGDFSPNSTDENPVHGYAASGVYNVSVSVSDATDTTACPVFPVTVQPLTCPAITSFTATPATVATGYAATLSWTTTNAATVSIDQGIGAVALSGSQSTGNLSSTTTYTITASKAGCAPDATQALQVDVTALPEFEAMGGACVDTVAPTPAATLIGLSGAERRGDDVFISASGSHQDVTLTLTTSEDETCGRSVFHVRLTGDDTFELTTNGVTTTVNDPSAALGYQSGIVTNPGGTTRTLTLVLRGSGSTTTKFTSITGDVTDAAGNTTVAVATPETLTVDTVAPSCTIDTPVEDATIGAFPIPGGITISASDAEVKGSGILDPTDPDLTLVDVIYRLAAAPVGSPLPTPPIVWNTAPSTGNGSASLNFVSEVTPFDSIEVQVQDIVGNTCSYTRNIAVDAAPPRFVRALPVSRGFIASATDTLTLEFYERDLSALQDDNVSLCNPSVPPDANTYRVALFDVTQQSYASYPLDTEELVPSCTGDFPDPPLRGDGTNIPTITTNPSGTTGNYFYTFIKLTGAPASVGHAPNVLTRGHTYQVRMRQVSDRSGNVMSPDVYTFSFYASPDPLRLTERVESALTTTYQLSEGVQAGIGAEVARFPVTDPAIDPTKHNCVNQFVIDPVANTTDTELLKSPYLVRHTLSLIADPSSVLQATIEVPFRLTSQLPPYFHVVDLDCADSGLQTQVRYQVYDSSNTPVGAAGFVALTPTLADTATTDRSYGTNVDYPVDPATFNKGEKGRKITIPFTPAELPAGVPYGGRIDVTYFTYVTGYE